MPPDLAAEIIETCRALWPSTDPIEVTLEANPSDRTRFAALAGAGVHRLSLGVQSLNDDALAFLRRDHDSAAAVAAIGEAIHRFPRVSLDLIYALPDQTADDWRADLTAALAFGCEHLSAYQLTLEPRTAFGRAAARGARMTAEPDAAADLYELTQELAGEAGLRPYEISNHASGRGARSRHNLAYWRGEDYLGIGPGAHGRITADGERIATLAARRIGDYIARVETGAGPERERLDPRQSALERLLMGLRTDEGVERSALAPLDLDPMAIASLAPFVGWRRDRLRLTGRGRPVLDAVLRRLVDGA